MRRDRPSSTAQNVAMARSLLTWSGVLDDPLAATMLRPRWAVTDRALRLRGAAPLARSRAFALVAARTLFYDDVVRRALDDGVRQVVVLAAGYDSRAWRMARRGVRFVELDHPATQADKRRRAPAGGPTYAPIDLRVDDLAETLRSAGVRPDEPTLFTLEGLTMYLPEPLLRTILRTMADGSGVDSRLATNFGLGVEAVDTRGGRAAAAVSRLSLALAGERVEFGLAVDEVHAFLAGTGWSTVQVITAPDLAERYASGTPLPTSGLRPSAFVVEAVR